jgi:heavy metal sensor kinase
LKKLTIQARLTAWYLLSLSIILGLFACGAWFAMKSSMYHSIDRDLGYRMATVVPFIQSHSLSTHEQFEREFANSSDSPVVGVFVQVTSNRGEILYESDVLRSHRVPVLAQGPADGSVLLSSLTERGWPVRFAAQRVSVAGEDVTVHVVEPLRDLLGALREYQLYLIILTLIALLLTATVGYWMSRRALAPVEQIRRDAEAIDPSDLTTRLQVPATDDELARLARTLNAMLARIESGFRSIEQFTADASHELRAPLALIMAAAEVSLRRERTSEELKDVLRKVVREARHMSNLVENLLDLARGDARQRHMELAPVDVAPILREIGAEMIPAASAKGLTLTAEIPEREVSVLGEGTQLRRLFLILVDNAIKYTEAGSVRLSLDDTGGEVIASVADSGIGIGNDAVPHVFDRFWRADKVRSRTAGGAGLGLSLAAQIVQRHNGSIAVDSELGQGSIFTVKLKASGNLSNS